MVSAFLHQRYVPIVIDGQAQMSARAGETAPNVKLSAFYVKDWLPLVRAAAALPLRDDFGCFGRSQCSFLETSSSVSKNKLKSSTWELTSSLE
jgi:hypothetical protein